MNITLDDLAKAEGLFIKSLADLEKHIRGENPNLEPLICGETKKKKNTNNRR